MRAEIECHYTYIWYVTINLALDANKWGLRHLTLNKNWCKDEEVLVWICYPNIYWPWNIVCGPVAKIQLLFLQSSAKTYVSNQHFVLDRIRVTFVWADLMVTGWNHCTWKRSNIWIRSFSCSDTKIEPASTSMTFMLGVVSAPEDPAFKLLPR